MALSPSDPEPILVELANINLSEPFTPVFHKFNDLPAELRTMIWRLAVPKPTVVERVLDNSTMSYKLRRHGPIPAVLHACYESRTELLHDPANPQGAPTEQFDPLHLSKQDKDDGRGIYLNYHNDTLLIYRAPSMAIMPNAANFANLENLAMVWGLRPCWVQGQCHHGVRFVRQFPALRTLTLLVNFVPVHGPSVSGTEKRREHKQRCRALREIKGWVLAAVAVAREDYPGWTPPEVRVVARTRYWSRAVLAAVVKESSS